MAAIPGGQCSSASYRIASLKGGALNYHYGYTMCESKREVPKLRGMGRDQIVIHGDLTEPTFGDQPLAEMLANWDAIHHIRSDQSTFCW